MRKKLVNKQHYHPIYAWRVTAELGSFTCWLYFSGFQYCHLFIAAHLYCHFNGFFRVYLKNQKNSINDSDKKPSLINKIQLRQYQNDQP